VSGRRRWEPPEERYFDADSGAPSETHTFARVVAPDRPRSKKRAPDGRPLAVFVQIEGQGFWCPQSAIHADSDVYTWGQEGKLVVAMWWARVNKLLPSFPTS
jgi:hypothetical protein